MSMETIDAPNLAETRQRVSLADPVYLEIVEFLYDEAALLDRDRVAEWAGLLTEDLTYWMPTRVTRERAQGQGFSKEMAHYDDDLISIRHRVRRLVETKVAWGEDPPSRVRRMITNILAYRGDHTDEYEVSSSILLIRNRFDIQKNALVSAERQDILRRTPDGWRLARRHIYVDQASLTTNNLAVFL